MSSPRPPDSAQNEDHGIAGLADRGARVYAEHAEAVDALDRDSPHV